MWNYPQYSLYKVEYWGFYDYQKNENHFWLG